MQQSFRREALHAISQVGLSNLYLQHGRKAPKMAVTEAVFETDSGAEILVLASTVSVNKALYRYMQAWRCVAPQAFQRLFFVSVVLH